MNWLIEIVVLILRALVPALVEDAVKRQAPSSEDGAPQLDLRQKLQQRIRQTWGAAALMCVLLFSVGCAGTRTIYVPDGTPVRLRETIPNAPVWVLDKDGKPTPGVMDLPSGWYALPIPEEE